MLSDDTVCWAWVKGSGAMRGETGERGGGGNKRGSLGERDRQSRCIAVAD